MKRELIYMDAKSSKFWTIELAGSDHTVTYGRIGTQGQTSRKSFPSPEAARKDFDKLVREKLTKGYVEKAAGQPAEEGLLPAVAFHSINRREEITCNVSTFVGQKVQDYDPARPARPELAYRFRTDWDQPTRLATHLDHFLGTPAAAQATALVIGAWHGEDSQCTPEAVVRQLIENRERLPQLKALYLGDITSEENEMSWIYQCDLAPLLEAFPQLQLLRTRGGQELAFSRLEHDRLRALALETGGMDASVVRAVCQARLPALEHLELWLGTQDYGATVGLEDLQPLLTGRLFPRLRYLGLRNSELADELAAVLVNSPVVQQLETLDLSLGVLTDEGGRALLKLASPTLRKLNLHYNYLSPEMVRQLKSLTLTVDASRPADMEEDEEWRFVAVGE